MIRCLSELLATHELLLFKMGTREQDIIPRTYFKSMTTKNEVVLLLLSSWTITNRYYHLLASVYHLNCQVS